MVLLFLGLLGLLGGGRDGSLGSAPHTYPRMWLAFLDRWWEQGDPPGPGLRWGLWETLRTQVQLAPLTALLSHSVSSWLVFLLPASLQRDVPGTIALTPLDLVCGQQTMRLAPPRCPQGCQCPFPWTVKPLQPWAVAACIPLHPSVPPSSHPQDVLPD